MKTLADFKRKIKPGQQWDAFNHLDNRSLGIRKVKTVQTNSFSFETSKGESWCEFPKAKDFNIVDENTVQIIEDGILILTYKYRD